MYRRAKQKWVCSERVGEKRDALPFRTGKGREEMIARQRELGAGKLRFWDLVEVTMSTFMVCAPLYRADLIFQGFKTFSAIDRSQSAQALE